MSHVRLGDVLKVEAGLSGQELDFALALQKASGHRERIGAILVGQGFISGECLARSLAVQAGWEYYEGEYVADLSAVEASGMMFFRERAVFPLKTSVGLAFVFSDSDDTRTTDLLTARFGRDVRFYIGIETDIRHALTRFDRRSTFSMGGALTDIKQLIEEAAVRNATDVHLEPTAETLNVRLRIDGVLHFLRAFPRSELPRIVNMFFHRAGISAGDFLRFHDARFEEEFAGRKLDIRLSHLPSVNGSSLVLRVLDKSGSAVPLAALGYSPGNQRQLINAVRRPNGLILFTGPTGCGKTTSLYALLGQLKGLGVKVVTAEDPVEVRLPLVTQVPVDLRREQDFHHITRALLRHDPDVVLIGEIRDEKTAREAMRAAITGHRVLGTLHTNDVISAILRLDDLGIDHAQISHALTCIIAQRLVRKLCPVCKVFVDSCQSYVHHAPGCDGCLGGYKGRTVLCEVMNIDDDMRFLIERGLIQEMSIKYKMRTDKVTMSDDAQRLIREGVVSREEVERVMG